MSCVDSYPAYLTYYHILMLSPLDLYFQPAMMSYIPRHPSAILMQPNQIRVDKGFLLLTAMPLLERIIIAMDMPTDKWITRRNKMHDERQFEVVHKWGDENLISDDTQKVVERFETLDQADAYAAIQRLRAVAQNVLSVVDVG